MNKRELRKLITQLGKHQKEVAKVRDALDDFISEADGLHEDCREAWDNLQDARDALSKLV
jgi:uncharacterized coiled-coil DUF342 family protein